MESRMMRFAFVFAALTSTVFANHLETVCKSSKQPVPGRSGHWYSNPPTFSGNLLSRRLVDDRGTNYVIERMNGEELYHAPARLSGVIEFEGSIWALEEYSILELDADGVERERHPIVFNPTSNEPRAYDFGLMQGLLVVARGSGGLTAFNPQTRKIQWHTELPEVQGSKPVAIAFDGEFAQVIMTGTREGGFNGIVKVELNDGKVLEQTAYDIRRAGVISPDAKAKWFNNSLVINNGGWIHIITAKQLAAGKPMKPRWLAVEVGDDMHLHYMMLEGEFFFEGNNLYGCGAYNERNGNDITRVARLFKVPMN